MSERSDAYLIVKRGLYYRPKAHGYTGIRDHAGRYTLDDAMGYSHPNGPNGPRDGITHVHEDDAPEFSDACCHDLKADHLQKQRDEARAEVLQLRKALARRQWQSMDTAPKDGRHCILAVQSGPFVYAVQGTYDEGRGRGWFNAADIEAEPLCWMPNVLVPDELLPWTDAFKARAALSPAPVVDAVKQGDA